MAEKKLWLEKELTCKPLDTYEDILEFLENPPPWRSLCVSLKPHSDSVVRNIEINPFFGQVFLELPQTFCHYDPGRPEVASDVQRQARHKLPKTLVCHDMANGYHDDCVIDGTGNYDAYTFYNWGGIDIFCYFSHHLITIPPLSWINVGHAHGVKVIGTVITEWSDGVVFWDKILSTEEEAQKFANALVVIAKTLKFEGWLLNIENKISKPESLLAFVRYLHSQLHQEIDGAFLIWYDSVTIEGNLNWQNALTEKNKAFFDVVDGFFTNYSWNEDDVAASAALAGDRLIDLFIGLDVWGRNFYGGGQFNVQEAIQVSHYYGCSLAIFAPAWTHEGYLNTSDINFITDSEELSKYEHFLLRDRALWSSIWPYLNTKLPCTLPFRTSFCRGQGKKRRLYGEVICPRPWYNLRHMQYQPNSSHGAHGYILSTQETIKTLSVRGIVDKTAINRYRKNLEMSRVEIFSEMNSNEDLRDKNEQEMLDTNKIDNEKIPPDSKPKATSYFRQLFRLNASKKHREDRRQQTETEAVTEPKDVADVASSAELTRSRSMVQVSVNLRLGHLGKTRYDLAYVPNERECLEPFYEDSFTGGSCLKINPSDEASSEHRLARLFHCDFYCDNSLIACVVTKTMSGYEDQYLNMELFVTNSAGKDVKVVLVGDSTDDTSKTSSDIVHIVYPSNTSSPTDPGFRNLQRYILLNDAGFYTPVENSFGWKVRYYEMPLPGARVTSINCRTGLSDGPILLGYFGLCSRDKDLE